MSNARLKVLSACLTSLTVLALAMFVQRSLSAQSKTGAAPLKGPAVHVPFVGCKSDGQLGPKDAPAGKTGTLSMTPRLADQLAYYKAEDAPGVLAPRGWYCFGTYGSSGSSLFITPLPINSGDLFNLDWKGFTGPAIQLSDSYGDTSGRFQVAEVIARVFPAHRAFVRRVIAEGIEPATSFPSGPYPKDTLSYEGTRIVEFITPPNTEGLGTRSRLQANDQSIDGVDILTGEEPSLVHLSVRLSSDKTDLARTIIQQVKRDAAAVQ
jgi:hypothetical protein